MGFLRYFAALALLLVASFAFIVILAGGKPDEDPAVDARFAMSDDARIERGRYLAVAGNCGSCHTIDGGGFMAGGVAFNTPFGTIYSTNITPDAETGIGDWTGSQFRNSMRRGVRPDGEHLYPAFPYTAFTKISDDDLAALFAYLKSVSAVRQEPAKNELSFPFNQRSLLAIWKSLFFSPAEFSFNESKSAEWNRGAYLADALAHCDACHSPRNMLGATRSALAMTGGVYTDRVPGGSLQVWSAPNLTASPHGLGIWSLDEVVAYLKNGINNFVETFGPMNEVIMNSTRHLSDDDVKAMAMYLKSLPANDEGARRPADRRVLGMGRTVYNLHCGTCHLPTGLGDEESAPRLAAGSLVVQAADPASLINVILYGPELPDPPLPTKRRKPMEEFQYLLTDAEIAAVASYVRATWGNAAGAVTASQVAEQR